jgi:anthranilate synthase component 1
MIFSPPINIENLACHDLKNGKSTLLTMALSADCETPISAMKKLYSAPYIALFESISGGEQKGRYSFIALDPDLIWSCSNNIASRQIFSNGIAQEKIFQKSAPLDDLRLLIAESSMDIPANLPNMAAGLFGFMGYGMVQQMENIPSNNPDNLSIADAFYMRPQHVLIFDNAYDTLYLTSPIWTKNPLTENEAKSRVENTRAAQKKLLLKLQEIPSSTSYEKFSSDYSEQAQKSPQNVSEYAEISAKLYEEMVEQAKSYIQAGDIFQVVLSQRFTLPFKHQPLSFYRALRHLNPSPFCFFLKMHDEVLIGSSPEILVRVQDKKITVRPIAGTRPRGKNPAEDANLAKDLLADKKECAEHLMLLDLGRNDVGRVAKAGTVRVTDSMTIENYSHVMHIVSNVEGFLRDDISALDALIAGFPAGTVSGAPKIRAMEIIDELEPITRSFYAGCVGYFSANGNMDSCITLRTGFIKNQQLFLQAGAGIVADSNPKLEQQECCNKAQALCSAAHFAICYEQ